MSLSADKHLIISFSRQKIQTHKVQTSFRYLFVWCLVGLNRREILWECVATNIKKQFIYNSFQLGKLMLNWALQQFGCKFHVKLTIFKLQMQLKPRALNQSHLSLSSILTLKRAIIYKKLSKSIYALNLSNSFVCLIVFKIIHSSWLLINLIFINLSLNLLH